MNNPNAKMKHSGVEWIGDIPEGWGVLPLKYFGVITLGKMLTPNEKSGYQLKPYLRSINVQADKINLSDVKEMWFSNDELERLKLKRGDLLLNEGGDVGRTSIWENELDECYFQNSINRVQFNKEKDLYYYFYYLSQMFHFTGYYKLFVNTVSISHLTKEKLEAVKFIRPPLKEQEQIVAYLDEKTSHIDKLLDISKRKIGLLKEQRASIINQVVTKGLNPNAKMKHSGVEWIGDIPEGWGLVRLKKFGTFFKGNGIKKEDLRINGIRCIRYGEIYTKYDRIVYEAKSFIDDEVAKMSVLINKGDLLFTGSGETIEDIGKAVLYFNDLIAFAGGDIIILRLNDYVDKIYSSYLINSNFVKHQKSLLGKGEIVVHIYSKDLKNIIVPLPPLEEQEQIVAYLDEKTSTIDKSISIEERRIGLLKEYRQSIISQVITGKIKVIADE